jgi:cell division transport system ATP-binding protein
MIRIKNLRKEYPNGLVALDNIDLRIQKNEFVYLVGSSGAGKSTLLRMIFRADYPTSGDIYIDNFSLSNLKPNQVPYLRRSIGVVFQDFKL